MDCSEQISREHYISKSVLDQIGKSLLVTGMPWLSPGETLETSVGSLTAKILCRRHNEALSPLDAEAAHFFSVIRQILTDLGRRRFSRKPIFHLVGGDAIETWMLKVSCGLFFSIGANDGIKLSGMHSIDLIKVQGAFFERRWDQRAGLYFRGTTGAAININSNVEIAPLSKNQRFGGAVVSFHGLTLEFLFDTTDTNPGVWTGLVRQPSELVLRNQQRKHHIVLTWPVGTPEACVIMDANNVSTPGTVG